MTLIQAILMGIIQGITEFLPISSSGHLAIFQNIFNIDTDTGLLFDVMLHMGTLVAVVLVYKKDIFRLIRETIRMIRDISFNLKLWSRNKRTGAALRYKKIVHNNYSKFVVLIIFSTIPTGIIGFVAKDLVAFLSKTLLVPGICLLITGVLLLITDFSGDGQKVPKDVSYSNGFLIGICQGIATLPGLSRSGTTIVACLLSGFNRKFAVKYSFIMSIPAIIGAALVELPELGSETVTFQLFGIYFIGSVVASFVGYFCIKSLLNIVKKKKFKYFAYYCFTLGFIAIVANYL